MPETYLHFKHSGQRGSIQRQRTAIIALRERYSVVVLRNDEIRGGIEGGRVSLYANSCSELAIAQREAVQLLVASGYTIL